MIKKPFTIILSFFIFITGYNLNAQYPKITEEVKKASEAYMQKAMIHSDSAWLKALPAIEEEARHGKPYIPWAARPTDLPQASIPAFPGAEGGGMYSFGGRGGKVLIVTSLEDSGQGTFREACETGGARIIVFNVAGIIRLQSPLIIRSPYLTIAGQTAPGDGICIAGESVLINTHDVIIRHMRFRRGETWVGRRDDALGGNVVGNVMIDHVSASWGLDENMSVYRHMYDAGNGNPPKKLPTVNITIQNSIFSEALDTYNHSFGSTLGGENCSFARNLWANNTGRNPSIGWNGVFNLVNNVIYNWMHRSVDGGDYSALYNIINNYYKPGPVTPKNSKEGCRLLKPESGRSNLGYAVYGRAYVNGNVLEGNDAITRDNWAGGVQVESFPDCNRFCESIRWDKPFPMAPLSIMPAQDAYEFVLSHAGATLPKRDPVDMRIIEQVRTNQIDLSKYVKIDTLYQFHHRRLDKDSYRLGIITDIAQVGGYPEYRGEPRMDSDNDGMPDAWEKKVGLNPDDASDAVKDMNGDGYTNIEKYINGIDPDMKVDWTDLKNNIETLETEDIIN
jgi:hypothetical protein